jgi:hypothetical protein
MAEATAMKTPAEKWDDYRRRTLPPDAGEVQVAETRRAFIAGMVCLDSALIEIAEMPIDEAEAVLSAIQDEMLKESLYYVSQDKTRAQA